MSETSYRAPRRQPMRLNSRGFDDRRLPAPMAWMAVAECGGSELVTSDAAQQRELGIELYCAECVVRSDCARRALDTSAEFYVWGGVDLTHLSRKKAVQELRRVVQEGETR